MYPEAKEPAPATEKRKKSFTACTEVASDGYMKQNNGEYRSDIVVAEKIVCIRSIPDRRW